MTTAVWQKSTRSEDYGNCVEVAALPGVIAVRDSKRPEVGHLTLTHHAFASLVRRVKEGELVR